MQLLVSHYYSKRCCTYRNVDKVLVFSEITHNRGWMYHRVCDAWRMQHHRTLAFPAKSTAATTWPLVISYPTEVRRLSWSETVRSLGDVAVVVD